MRFHIPWIFAITASVQAPFVQVPFLQAAPSPYCAHAPRNPWVSALEIEQKLQQLGWKLLFLRIGDDRCYLARARDALGAVHDLVIHPANADILQAITIR
jgi:Peptidase propeptide and YPEB domain